MPAIDPDRLTRQVADVVGAIGDPTELRRRALDLLELYADRTRRPGPSTQVDDVPPSFGVPRPVMRALTSSLVRAAAGRPERALSAADELWRANHRESRLLAVALVGSLDSKDAPAWLERHAAAADDNVVLGEMGGRGLAAWRMAEPHAFVDSLRRWLDSSRRATEHMALLAVAAAAEDPQFHQLPSLFPLLSGRCGSYRGEIRGAFIAAIRALSRRSPPEATFFLMAEVDSGDPAAVRVARAALDTLPRDDATRLRRALSAKHRR
jgi:hypothetical protein